MVVGHQICDENFEAASDENGRRWDVDALGDDANPRGEIEIEPRREDTRMGTVRQADPEGIGDVEGVYDVRGLIEAKSVLTRFM
jgi:hypothetical protein